MNKAVFLDRDGVINRELGHYCEKVEDFEILQDVGRSIKVLKDAGFLVIVISNQGGIAKGLYTEADVEVMRSKMRLPLGFCCNYRRFLLLSPPRFHQQMPLS